MKKLEDYTNAEITKACFGMSVRLIAQVNIHWTISNWEIAMTNNIFLGHNRDEAWRQSNIPIVVDSESGSYLTDCTGIIEIDKIALLEHLNEYYSISTISIDKVTSRFDRIG